MGERIAVHVRSRDPVLEVGIAGQLRGRPEVVLVDSVSEGQVVVVVTDHLNDDACRMIREINRSSSVRVIVVAADLDDAGVLAAVEAGASAMLRRCEVTPERLTATIATAYAGDGSVPPDVLGRLLAQVGALQRQVLAPRGITLSGFTTREVEVLKLLADGFDTAEVAETLAYSERTIKNVIHDVNRRLNLRNRTHAVAFALRQGLI